MDSPSPLDFKAPSLDELAPLFPGYEITAFIAQGGMGAVYKARQKSLDRDVAIKILPREFGEDSRFRASFESEAKSMARLNHPNLISVHDFGHVDGMLYIVMEFVQGRALFYSSNKQIIAPKVALPLISALLRGLAHAHKSGIIHRDIKPANILLDTDANPKLGDFGLARASNFLKTEKFIYGTPGYIAPEVYLQQPVDHRSDLYSVGKLLSELLTGIRPLPDTPLNASGTDPRIDAIISKATHADLNQRFASADEFAGALDVLLPKLVGPRFTTSPVTRTASPPPQTLTSQKKSSALPVFAVLALCLACAIAAFFAFSPKDPPQPVAAIPSEKPITKKAEVTKPKSKPKPKQPRSRPRKNKEAVTAKLRPKPHSKPKTNSRKPPLSPWESLLQLRGPLRNGNFEKLPVGTVKRNQSAYFIPPKAMTAAAAHALAEDLGGSLAIAKSKDDLDAIRTSFPNSPTLWLGASDSGLEGKWYWVDGSPVSKSLWATRAPDNKSDTSREGQDFAALTPNGLEDFARTAKFRPVIEWRLNGPNPGSALAQIKRASKTIAAKKPIFPAATFEFKGSRYLIFQKWTRYPKATSIAESGGGHLAVLSSPEEARHLTSFMNNFLKEEKDKGCWFGGSRSKGDRKIWTTPTGEIFNFHPWLANEPNDKEGDENNLEYRQLATTEKFGFNDASERRSNKYLLIEWSHPSKRNLPKTSPQVVNTSQNSKAASEALGKIREKIRSHHGRAYRKYRRQHDKAVHDYLNDTISSVNNHKKIAAPLKATLVERLQKSKERDALPGSFTKAAPFWLKKELEEAHTETKAIREDYQKDFTKAKTDYLQRLSEAAKTASKMGLPNQTKIYSLEKKAIAKDDKRLDQILDNQKVPLPTAKPAPPKDKDK